MAYPDRTSGTVTLPGAAATTNFLDSPVDGGKDGDATAAMVKPIEDFATTEATGVGVVRTTGSAE